ADVEVTHVYTGQKQHAFCSTPADRSDEAALQLDTQRAYSADRRASRGLYKEGRVSVDELAAIVGPVTARRSSRSQPRGRQQTGACGRKTGDWSRREACLGGADEQQRRSPSLGPRPAEGLCSRARSASLYAKALAEEASLALETEASRQQQQQHQQQQAQRQYRQSRSSGLTTTTTVRTKRTLRKLTDPRNETGLFFAANRYGLTGSSEGLEVEYLGDGPFLSREVVYEPNALVVQASKRQLAELSMAIADLQFRLDTQSVCMPSPSSQVLPGFDLSGVVYFAIKEMLQLYCIHVMITGFTNMLTSKNNAKSFNSSKPMVSSDQSLCPLVVHIIPTPAQCLLSPTTLRC
ncbi:unnamed protein product, partial [Protopolystoma xenopodis]